MDSPFDFVLIVVGVDTVTTSLTRTLQLLSDGPAPALTTGIQPLPLPAANVQTFWWSSSSLSTRASSQLSGDDYASRYWGMPWW